MKKTLGIVLAVATAGMSSTALGAGFQRGTADTDVLFEPGTVSYRVGITYVDPRRGFESVNGVSGNFGNYTGSYEIPSHALYLGNEFLGCAGTYTESFAAEADYTSLPGGALPRQVSSTDSISNRDRLNFGPNTGATSRTQSIEFDTDEFGLTCRASYPSDMGRFSLLGGVFFEDFSFEGRSLGFRNLNPLVAASGAPGAGLVAGLNLAVPGAQITLPSQIQVRSRGEYQAGYRIGAAYEMPEIALRAQVMYRSEVEHDDIRGTGTVTITDTAFATVNGQRVSVPGLDAFIAGVTPASLQPGRTIAVDSFVNTVASPQSLVINAQTGIAEGTLLLGSFRWTDWSTNNAVVSTISSTEIGTSSSYQPYFWRDGYTASIGLGRAFNEQISGLVQVGYDSGVSTGADTTYTDLYLLSGGLSFRGNEWSELRLGGLVGYWTSGEQSVAEGSYYNATVGDDFVYGLSGSIKLTF